MVNPESLPTAACLVLFLKTSVFENIVFTVLIKLFDNDQSFHHAHH